MKVERITPKPSFAPVVLTLETEAEVMLLAKLYGAICTPDAVQVGGVGVITDDWYALKRAVGEAKYDMFPSLEIKVNR